jgi:ubiquitin-protein ligase
MQYFEIDELLHVNENRFVCKRLHKEITTLQEKSSNLQVASIGINDNRFTVVTIYDLSIKNINTYEFEITNDYPFRCPKILVNYRPYTHFLQIKTTTFANLLYQMYKIPCLCCNSYNCFEKWSPGYTLLDIIHEIQKVIKYKRNIINKYYADKIKSKYFISDIDLDSWLF